MVNYLIHKKGVALSMTYDFNDLFVSPLNNNEKVPPMPPLESDEEAKKGK